MKSAHILRCESLVTLIIQSCDRALSRNRVEEPDGCSRTKHQQVPPLSWILAPCEHTSSQPWAAPSHWASVPLGMTAAGYGLSFSKLAATSFRSGQLCPKVTHLYRSNMFSREPGCTNLTGIILRNPPLPFPFHTGYFTTTFFSWNSHMIIYFSFFPL